MHSSKGSSRTSELLLAVVFGIAVGFLFAWLYYRSRAELVAKRLGDEIGRRVFEDRRAELEGLYDQKYRTEFAKWKVEAEKELRRDALARSRAVIKGKVAEQLTPIFDVFGYEPSDAKFIGDPVDYVIFDGYTEVRERKADRPIAVVVADIKTGEAGLTYEQKRIKAGVKQGIVRFETIRM